MTTGLRYVQLAEGDDKTVHRLRQYEEGGHKARTDCQRVFVAYDLLQVPYSCWQAGLACPGCSAHLLTVVDDDSLVWAEVPSEGHPTGWFRAVNREERNLWLLGEIARAFGLRSVE